MKALLITVALALAVGPLLGCSDDNGNVTPDTVAQSDLSQSDGQVSDTIAPDGVPDGPPATPDGNTDATVAEAGADAGTTACGTKTCNAATEICVETVQQIGPKYDCKAVPAGCESDRTCACLGAQVCDQSPYLTCGDGAAGSNKVSCSCPNC